MLVEKVAKKQGEGGEGKEKKSSNSVGGSCC